MTSQLTSIVSSMYNARQLTLDIVERIFIPGIINNASQDKQLILIDDESPEKKATEDMIDKYKSELKKKYGDFKIIRNKKNLGFGGSYNKGIQLADGENMIIVNDDLYLTKGSVDSLVNTLLEDDNHGIVGPVSTYQSSFQNTKLLKDIDIADPETIKKIEDFSGWLKKVMKGKIYELKNSRGMGSCFALKKSSESYFDKRFKFGFWEDTDLNKRIMTSGKKSILDASVYTWHRGSASVCSKKIKAGTMLFINGMKYIKKWGHPIDNASEFFFSLIQLEFDYKTITEEIVKKAKEKNLWKEYLLKFKN